MTDFYKLPFKQAKRYLPRIYLSLDFIKDLNLKVETLDLKAIYTNSSIGAILLIDDKESINKYVQLGLSEVMEKEVGSQSINIREGNFLEIGYKHFDKWKFNDGEQIGDFRSDLMTKPGKVWRLQRMIQRKVLGFWKYWYLKLRKEI